MFTSRRVRETPGVVIKCSNTDGCVVAFIGVAKERAKTVSRVIRAERRVAKKRLKPGRRVLVRERGVPKKCLKPVSRV